MDWLQNLLFDENLSLIHIWLRQWHGVDPQTGDGLYVADVSKYNQGNIGTGDGNITPVSYTHLAGAGSRVALGAAGVFGMAVNTIFSTVYIPNWYEVMQNIQEKWLTKKQ